MRGWHGKWSITRAVVLLACLAGLLEPGDLQVWLEKPSPGLNGVAPVDLLEAGEWTVLADLIDDMLTGAPT